MASLFVTKRPMQGYLGADSSHTLRKVTGLPVNLSFLRIHHREISDFRTTAHKLNSIRRLRNSRDFMEELSYGDADSNLFYDGAEGRA